MVLDKDDNLKLIDLGSIVNDIRDYGKKGHTHFYSLLYELSTKFKLSIHMINKNIYENN